MLSAKYVEFWSVARKEWQFALRIYINRFIVGYRNVFMTLRRQLGKLLTVVFMTTAWHPAKKQGFALMVKKYYQHRHCLTFWPVPIIFVRFSKRSGAVGANRLFTGLFAHSSAGFLSPTLKYPGRSRNLATRSR